MEFVDLHTERLLLRQPNGSDVDEITELCQDGEIASFTTIPQPYRRAHAESFVRQVIPGDWTAEKGVCWGVCLETRPDILLGVVSIAGIADGIGRLGYWIGPAERGTGIMTEAARRAVQFCFAGSPEGLGLHRIEWEALSENVASARVAQKLGFRWEGRRRSAGIRFGRRHDLELAGLLRDDPIEPRDWRELAYV
jgi:RimJ/RimL family protein N-acetyltransferase